MTTKADFTAAEWHEIRRAPFMAGLLVVAASPSGPFGIIKEMFAVGTVLADVKAHGTSNDLVKALVADLETAEAREQGAPAELHGKNPAEIKTAALDACRKVASLVDAKVKPAEAEGFKQWLLLVSQKVAAAAKEGGFLGFGGTQVSEQEASALKELALAMDTKGGDSPGKPTA